MHACITLVLDHQEGHAPMLPVVELPADPDGEARVWFRDDGEDRIVGVRGRPVVEQHPDEADKRKARAGGLRCSWVHVVSGAEEVPAMAMTKARLDELTRLEGKLHDREAMALEDAWLATGVQAPPTAAGNGPVAAVARKPFAVRLLESITGGWAAIGAVTWVALLTIGIAVEPPPDNPSAVDPWFVSALGSLLLVALLSTLVGFWLRRRWGLAASLVASGLLVISTVMCPLGGHHTGVGAWWVVQLGCGLGLATTSILGLRRA